MRIGLDFDNTIIFYDEVFRSVASSRGLVPAGWSGSKTALRDYLRTQAGGEIAWQGLQGYVYGKGIGGAALYPGVREFLTAARRRGATVFVVSHKTRYGHQDEDRTDLRRAAQGWLDRHDLTVFLEEVFFEDTLAAKVRRIAALDLDLFIDDLPEVFRHPEFPAPVSAILFGPAADGQRAYDNWQELCRAVFS